MNSRTNICYIFGIILVAEVSNIFSKNFYNHELVLFGFPSTVFLVLSKDVIFKGMVIEAILYSRRKGSYSLQQTFKEFETIIYFFGTF